MNVWKPWTVRTYNILLRTGANVWSKNEAIHFANLCACGMVRNAGKKVAAELYRAAGLGVYEIAGRIGKPVEETRLLCEWLDRSLHESLD